MWKVSLDCFNVPFEVTDALAHVIFLFGMEHRRLRQKNPIRTTFLSIPSDHFHDIIKNNESADCASKICPKEEPGADALYEPGGYECITLRMESQDFEDQKHIL